MEIELYNFDIQSSYQCGDLFHQMLKLRHKAFVQEEKYNTFECDGMEFDQFDNPFTKYVAVTISGRVIGCARFGRMDIPYMAKDIWYKQIPEKYLPSDKNSYEFTRLYADSALLPPVRNKIIRIISSYAFLCLESWSAKAFYFVTYQSVFNSCAKLGFDAEILCNIEIDGYENIKYCRAIVDKTKINDVKTIMNNLINSIDISSVHL